MHQDADPPDEPPVALSCSPPGPQGPIHYPAPLPLPARPPPAKRFFPSTDYLQGAALHAAQLHSCKSVTGSVLADMPGKYLAIGIGQKKLYQCTPSYQISTCAMQHLGND